MTVIPMHEDDLAEDDDLAFDLQDPGCKPFIRWVGSKVQLLTTLRDWMPKRFGMYAEPFIGGGALFFSTQPRHASLSDANPHLVRTYTAIRDDIDGVIAALRVYADGHAKCLVAGTDEGLYYHVRDNADPNAMDGVNAAAWFLYLNKTNFNGLWRVNGSGKNNVPYGRRKNVTILDETTLRACSAALQRATIKHQDFREMAGLPPGSFVYFDPPYAPLSETADFTGYTKDKFTATDQRDLRDLALALKKKGVNVLLSNSSAPIIRELYAPGFEIREVAARRNVAASVESRAAVTELLIR